MKSEALILSSMSKPFSHIDEISCFQIFHVIDYPVWIGNIYRLQKEIMLVCELMKQPFRELLLHINEVLHVFSKPSVQLLVLNIINVKILGPPIGPDWVHHPLGAPKHPLLWCRGFMSAWGWHPDLVRSTLEVPRSPVLPSGWTLDRCDSLLSSSVSSHGWILSLTPHTAVSGTVNGSCPEHLALPTLPPWCRTGWGPPLASSSSSFSEKPCSCCSLTISPVINQ